MGDAAQRLRLVEVRYLAELPARHCLIEPLAGNGAQGRMADGGRGRAAGGGGQGGGGETVPAALWNRNYFFTVTVPTFEKFWLRFQLLKSYGSGYFWKVTVPVPVPAPYQDHKKQIFQKKIWKMFCLFT